MQQQQRTECTGLPDKHHVHDPELTTCNTSHTIYSSESVTIIHNKSFISVLREHETFCTPLDQSTQSQCKGQQLQARETSASMQARVGNHSAIDR